MKEIFNNHWNNFKKQPDIWFFFGFLLTFPLSIRKVLFFFPIRKTFNEYAGIYLYASDVFFLLILLSLCFSILKNNNLVLSRYKLWTNTLIHNLYLSIPAFLVIISFISIFWSQNQIIALYRSIKLLEAYLIYLYIATRFIPITLFHVEQFQKINFSNQNVPRGTFWIMIKKILRGFFKKQNASPTTKNSITKNALYKATDCNVTTFQSRSDGQITCNTETIVPRGTINEKNYNHSNCSTWNNFILFIIFMGLFQSIVAIWQFILQHSIGLFWLKESLISPNIPGVAKLILHNQKYIRAYGLFPHPNILGGFLLFSIVITFLYKNQIVINCSTWNNWGNKRSNNSRQSLQLMFPQCYKTIKLFHVEQFMNWSYKKLIVPRGTIHNMSETAKRHIIPKKLISTKKWLIYWALLIQILALFLSLSKSAIIALLITFVYIQLFHVEQLKKNISKGTASRNVPRGTSHKEQLCLFFSNQKNCYCSTWNIFKLFTTKHFKKIALIICIVISLILISKPNLNAIFLQSLNERLFYINASPVVAAMSNLIIVPRGTIHNLSALMFGIGSGQFVLNIPEYAKKTVEIWQFQPVHNIFLEMWSELGIFGLGLFLWLISQLFHVEQLGKNTSEELPVEIVPRLPRRSEATVRGGTIEEQDSNLKNLAALSAGEKMERGDKQNKYILCNNYSILSIETILHYFQAILLGFLFIGLFDHYFWDIWPGQILLWMVMGVVAGIKAYLSKISLDKNNKVC